jgi:carbonic anhydrase
MPPDRPVDHVHNGERQGDPDVNELLDGLRRFQRDVLPGKRQLFERIAEGQNPHTLFVGCSDSRVDPNLLTSTEPGELFVLRNAGNVVPPYGASTGGEASAVEFAVHVLGVKRVVVCGHSGCGAIHALLEEEAAADLPAMQDWLRQFEATRRIVSERRDGLGPDELMEHAIQANVLIQLSNLMTHPVVAARMQAGRLELLGCVYWIETGVVAYTVPNDRGGWDWAMLRPDDLGQDRPEAG